MRENSAVRSNSPESSIGALEEEGEEDGEAVEKVEVEKKKEPSEKLTTGFTPTFLLFFSSGTTGLPRPVEISHHSFIVQMQQLR